MSPPSEPGAHGPVYVQIHPKVNVELGNALERFAKNNGLTMNRAAVHVLTLGLHEMERQYAGSLSQYITSAREEIH